jgi:hypothetical protein
VAAIPCLLTEVAKPDPASGARATTSHPTHRSTTSSLNRHQNSKQTTAILIDTACESGKFPEPYHHAALVNSVDRKKPNKNPPQNKNSHTSQHPPLQSPYTRVYGKRKIFDIPPDISKLKLTPYRYKMTGQGGSRGAARDLTADPDFEMQDVISPPQGTKISGANKSTSAEKKNETVPKETPSTEKKNRTAPKETPSTEKKNKTAAKEAPHHPGASGSGSK